MKLDYSLNQIAKIIQANGLSDEMHLDSKLVETIAYDSRKILYAPSTLFFCLVGQFRDGHSFINDAYQRGVRFFCVSEGVDFKEIYKDAIFLKVKETLWALQELAKHHRKRFSIPVIAITGSVGKTSVKEWIHSFLSTTYPVIKSPKSYNSQLGVALSLLEISTNHQIAIIECGISKPDEMSRLEEIVSPTLGVFTAFGRAHSEHFESKKQQLQEKLKLFIHCEKVFCSDKIEIEHENSIFQMVSIQDYAKRYPYPNELNSFQKENLSIALSVAEFFNLSKTEIL